MIVTIEHSTLEIPPPRTERGKGVHISSIIRCIAQETGILKPEWCEELDLLEVNPVTRFSDLRTILRICIGLAFEEWYIPRLPGVVDHPGEMACSDIYLNHDGEELSRFIIDGFDRMCIVVHEVKTTYKSIRTVGVGEDALKSQWMWLAQLKSYCKANNTRFAILHVLFICGDYSYPIGPDMWIYHVEFTQEEIDDNWELMEQYRDDRLKIEMRQRGL
ncbi:MAG: hypothetical protein ACREJN_21440 [Nitrospiraceae bacterium]